MLCEIIVSFQIIEFFSSTSLPLDGTSTRWLGLKLSSHCSTEQKNSTSNLQPTKFEANSKRIWSVESRITLNLLTLKVTTTNVTTLHGVPISVTGIAQVRTHCPPYCMKLVSLRSRTSYSWFLFACYSSSLNPTVTKMELK